MRKSAINTKAIPTPDTSRNSIPLMNLSLTPSYISHYAEKRSNYDRVENQNHLIRVRRLRKTSKGMGSVGSPLHFIDFGWTCCYEYQRRFSISFHHNIFSLMVGTFGYFIEFKTIRDKSVRIHLCRNIIQTMCLIIYCSAPVMFLTVLVTIMNLLFHAFFLNLILSIGAILFTLKCNYSFFKTMSSAEKQYLNLYPVLLFYASICLFISMI